MKMDKVEKIKKSKRKIHNFFDHNLLQKKQYFALWQTIFQFGVRSSGYHSKIGRLIQEKEVYPKLIIKQVKYMSNASTRNQNNRQKNFPPEDLRKVIALLDNRAPVAWIFIVAEELKDQQKKRITLIYNGYGSASKGYIVPLYKRCYQIFPFLELRNTKLKIISDLKNIDEVIRLQNDEKIEEIYIYNQKEEDGFSTALAAKEKCEKVKGIFMDLDELIDAAQDQTENDLRFLQNQRYKIQHNRICKFLPNYMLLSGVDKTRATLYRGNLYAARNLPQSERERKFYLFMDLVQEKYGTQKDEHLNIFQYFSLNEKHSQPINNLEVAGKILNFYSRETFYYKTLNSMLRVLKSPKEFSSCAFPFHETYKSIRLYYRQTLLRNNRTIPEMTLYRGAKLTQRESAKLKIGSYIQMYGFMSTSLNEKIAKKFTDSNNDVIFIIKVPKMSIPEEYDDYDHGFVNLNQHNLTEEFSNEEQVLFNALNVYKVTEKFKDKRGYINYVLQYGSIFNLIRKIFLTSRERQIFTNYQYCAKMLSRVEDEGDTLLLHSELKNAQKYYDEKEKNRKNMYKLANVQYLRGDLQKAEKNARESLKKAQADFDKADKEKCKIICSSHMLMAKIKISEEDYFKAEEQIEQTLGLLDKDEITFERANAYRKRGEIRFKKGEVVGSEQDFLKSEKILNKILENAMCRKLRAKFDFAVGHISLLWKEQTKKQLNEWYDDKIQTIQEEEKNSELLRQHIYKERNKVLQALRKVADYEQDKEKYEICVKQGKQYLLQVKTMQTDDIHQQAKIKTMEAQVEGYQNLMNSERLIKQGIQLIERKEPMNEKIAEYSQKLAKFQKINLEKYMNPKGSNAGELSQSQIIEFDKEEDEKLYKRCKANLRRSERIISYKWGNKSEEVLNLRNQMAELQQYQNNFTQSEKILAEAKKQIGNNHVHTNLAKTIFLQSKIAFARGQLKLCFDKINESKKILKEARVRTQEQGEAREKQLKCYRGLDLYLQLKTHRAKVYKQQMNRDLSLKDINCAEYFLRIKGKETPLLPDVLELKGQIMCLSEETMYDCDACFEQAIDMREKQHGFYNIQNANTYCNFAKRLILFEDFQMAKKLLGKAIKIFSRFQAFHPARWVLHYVNALFRINKYIKQNQNEKNEEEIEEALGQMRLCLQMIEKQCDQSNITRSKLQYEYGKSMCQIGKSQRGIDELQCVQDKISNNLSLSGGRFTIQSDYDDEKVFMKRQIYEIMKRQYDKEQQNIRQSQKCLGKIASLENRYRMRPWTT